MKRSLQHNTSYPICILLQIVVFTWSINANEDYYVMSINVKAVTTIEASEAIASLKFPSIFF
jgi:hypothetical protein